MLADLYHLAANGENLSTVIAEQIGEIGHVQFADFPGRGLPGTGGLDLERALADLRGAGYKGWVSLECDAGEDTNANVALALARWRGGSTSAENPIT
jgi:hydroxypyruvate isomerase